MIITLNSIISREKLKLKDYTPDCSKFINELHANDNDLIIFFEPAAKVLSVLLDEKI